MLCTSQVVFTVHFVALIAYLVFSTYLLFTLYMGDGARNVENAAPGRLLKVNSHGTTIEQSEHAHSDASTLSNTENSGPPSAMSTNEMIWAIWSLARMADEVSDLGTMNRESFRLYIRDVWNQVDVMMSLIVIAIISLRVGVRFEEMAILESSGGSSALPAGFDPEEFAPAVWARNLYGILMMLAYLRLLQFLRYYKALGVLSIVLNNMIRDVLNFIAILLVFTLGFGLALAVITNGESLGFEDGHRVGAELVMGNHPIWSTWWGMVSARIVASTLSVSIPLWVTLSSFHQHDHLTIFRACVCV